MAKGELIDDRVSVEQCKKAVAALHAHATKHAKAREESELLPGREEHVWLVLTTKKMFPEKKLKPFKIPIVHPLVDPRTESICLITKDPQREYKDLLAAHNIKFISRVVGIEKLRGKFKPYEARRMLLKENGMFLADERVVPLLPGLLGKKFFDAKKQPIPVSLTRKDLKGELERAISSTYMHQNQGTCTSIKIGTLSQTPTQILANLVRALPEVVKHTREGWDNVQALNVKTSGSVALPVWACSLREGEGGRWEEGWEEWTGVGNEGKEKAAGPSKDAGSKTKRKAAKGAVEMGNERKLKRTRTDVQVDKVVEAEDDADADEENITAITLTQALNSQQASADEDAERLSDKPKKSKKSKSKSKAQTPPDEGDQDEQVDDNITALTLTQALNSQHSESSDSAGPKSKKGKKHSKPHSRQADDDAEDSNLTATSLADALNSKAILEKKALKDSVKKPKSKSKKPAPSLAPADGPELAADAPENTPDQLSVSQLIRAVELKTKKAASSLEKKKDKVTKGRHAGSKKEGILGKAVKARV